jgi:hypothetical protein
VTVDWVGYIRGLRPRAFVAYRLALLACDECTISASLTGSVRKHHHGDDAAERSEAVSIGDMAREACRLVSSSPTNPHVLGVGGVIRGGPTPNFENPHTSSHAIGTHPLAPLVPYALDKTPGVPHRHLPGGISSV